MNEYTSADGKAAPLMLAWPDALTQQIAEAVAERLREGDLVPTPSPWLDQALICVSFRVRSSILQSLQVAKIPKIWCRSCAQPSPLASNRNFTSYSIPGAPINAAIASGTLPQASRESGLVSRARACTRGREPTPAIEWIEPEPIARAQRSHQGSSATRTRAASASRAPSSSLLSHHGEVTLVDGGPRDVEG